MMFFRLFLLHAVAESLNDRIEEAAHSVSDRLYLLHSSISDIIQLNSRQSDDQRHAEAFFSDIRVYLAAHKGHKPLADKEPETVSLHILRVAAAMEALEYLGKLLLLKAASRI